VGCGCGYGFNLREGASLKDSNGAQGNAGDPIVHGWEKGTRREENLGTVHCMLLTKVLGEKGSVLGHLGPHRGVRQPETCNWGWGP